MYLPDPKKGYRYSDKLSRKNNMQVPLQYLGTLYYQNKKSNITIPGYHGYRQAQFLFGVAGLPISNKIQCNAARMVTVFTQSSRTLTVNNRIHKKIVLPDAYTSCSQSKSIRIVDRRSHAFDWLQNININLIPIKNLSSQKR